MIASYSSPNKAFGVIIPSDSPLELRNFEGVEEMSMLNIEFPTIGNLNALS